MDYFSRERSLETLKQEEFDLLIVGGGIIGSGIARDAAMRGLKVALVEAKDFACGTSSRSSKMLHGGIRYLEQLHLGLVFEASRERRLHSQKLCPHLSRPEPFFIPVYPWSPHGRAAVSFGVFLYDALALFRNHGTRYLNRDQSIQEEPNLESAGLNGSVVFHDVVMDDARINIEVARSAAFHGATMANYVVVRGFEKDTTGHIIGAWVRDEILESNDFLIKAKLVINATGPWSDYLRRLADPEVKAMLRPTKGVHLVLPAKCLGKSHAFVLTAKKDNRVFFSIPWFDRTLVGTTDTDYNVDRDGDLHDIHANADEIDYLLESCKRTFPGANVQRGDVLSTFAGVRPLVADPKSSNPSAVSREHLIWRDTVGLLNIAGGKYTTYRTMAKELVDKALEILVDESAEFRNRAILPSRTHLEELVMIDKERNSIEPLKEIQNNFDPDIIAHLQQRYGPRWQDLTDLAMASSKLKERIIPGAPDILAEVEYAKKQEMAQEFNDFLRRRTLLALKYNLTKSLPQLNKAFKLFRNNESVTLLEADISSIQGQTTYLQPR